MTDYATRDPLSDEELDTFVALRRVAGPRSPVSELNGHYFHQGRPMVPWLEDPLTALIAAGLITLADPDPDSCGLRRASLTPAGYTRYQQLCARQHLDPPAP